MHLCEYKIFVSSANKMKLSRLDDSMMSLIYIKKRRNSCTRNQLLLIEVQHFAPILWVHLLTTDNRKVEAVMCVSACRFYTS